MGQVLDGMDNLCIVHPAAHLDAGQTDHAFTGKRIEGTVDEHAESFFPGNIQNRFITRLIFLHRRARFEQVEGKLDHPTMMRIAHGRGNLPYPLQRGEFGILGRCGEGVGADAVKPNAPPLHLIFQVTKRPLDSPVVFLLSTLTVNPLLVGPPQVILGIVQQVCVKGVQAQPLQGPLNLIVEKPRVNAVFQTIGVFDDLLERIAVSFALLTQGIVVSLKPPLETTPPFPSRPFPPLGPPHPPQPPELALDQLPRAFSPPAAPPTKPPNPAGFFFPRPFPRPPPRPRPRFSPFGPPRNSSFHFLRCPPPLPPFSTPKPFSSSFIYPIEDIGSAEILPSLIVTHAAPVMVVQRQAAVAALAANKIIHIGVDPDTGRCARYRPRTGLDRSTEHPGADAGQVLRIRCVSIQTIHDPLLKIRLAGWDQSRIAGHLSPNRTTVSIP